MAEVKRRTFEAKNHPKGSKERARLNGHPLTSEYMPSYRYSIVMDNGKPFTSYVTKSAAEADLPGAIEFERKASA